jgi:hypothetical protein
MHTIRYIYIVSMSAKSYSTFNIHDKLEDFICTCSYVQYFWFRFVGHRTQPLLCCICVLLESTLRLILSDDTPCPHKNSFSEKWRHMEKIVSLAGQAVSRTQQIFAVSEDVTHGFSILTHQNRVFRVSTSESRVSIGRHTKNFLTNRTTGF